MADKKIFTASNLLSFLRLLLVIPFWIVFDNFDNVNARYIAAALGIFASVTDILDGYLARKLNQVTEYGKIIDPLADKVLIGFVVIKLFLIGEIPAVYFWLIIGRDIVILIGGVIITKITGFVIPSDWLGKLTVMVISFVLLMIFFRLSSESVYFLIMYYSSIALVFVSLIHYAVRAEKIIKSKNENI